MSDAPTIQFKKPLNKMTAVELRKLVGDQIPQISGAAGMAKDALIAAVKEALGTVPDADGKTANPYKPQISAMKKSIRGLRVDKKDSDDRKKREEIRKKINKIKKRTRRLAKAA